MYSNLLPDKVKGEGFLRSYGSHHDEVTRIDPSSYYPVKAPTAHAVYENFRTKVVYLRRAGY